MKYLLSLGLVAGACLLSPLSFSETLCHTCEVEWVETELTNGDIQFRSVDNIGSGACVGTYMTTHSSTTDRQKDQMISALLAAMMAGKKVTASGATTGCGSLTHITVKKD